VATAAAALGWIIVEKLRDGHSTPLGSASGAVAGLVGITPACAYISPLGSIALGLVCGVLCAYAVGLKYKLGFDDSLDVVGVHLVGGIAGSLLVGLLATHIATATGGVDGLLYGGGFSQLLKQFVAVVAVGGYSFVVSFILGKLIDKTMGFRISEEDEVTGVDLASHAETAYEFANLGGTLGGAAKALSLSAQSAQSGSTTQKVDA
jgi:Amt family ammonium transporter